VQRDGDSGARRITADGRSRIGLASSRTRDGPWIYDTPPFAARPDHFDAWHLSTGPVVGQGSERPVMFYNGATRGYKASFRASRGGLATIARACSTICSSGSARPSIHAPVKESTPSAARTVATSCSKRAWSTGDRA